MTWQEDTMMNPPIESLMERAQSKFMLVTLAATRAREVNAYFNHLGDGLGSLIPPQVASTAAKPLSIAFEEIAANKITFEMISEEAADTSEDEAELENVVGDLPGDDLEDVTESE